MVGGPIQPKAAMAAALVAMAIAMASCGGAQTYTAEEFVDSINEEGVEMRLGEPLITDDESQELYSVELEPVARLPGSGGAHTGGSISEFDDPSDAEGELSSCGASADLLCYRLANIVVVLEGGGIEAQQLGVAMERLSED